MAKRDPVTKKSGRFSQQQFAVEGNADVVPFERGRKHRGQNHNATANANKRVECLNEAQTHYYLAIKTHRVTLGLGPAGTGKTHIAVGRACEQLMDKEIDSIIVTRPLVGVDEEMGYLPGELEEKFEPFFAPVRAIMESFLGYNHLDNLLRTGKIVVKPLQFIRGCTFDRSFMILDEAQNTTKGQMKAFLTRIGKYTTCVVNGDIEQVDLPKGPSASGLVDFMKRVDGDEDFGQYTFTESDIVRDDIVRKILLAYRKQI